MRFKDKVAIVTGAGQGIGEAYAGALAAEGGSVVVADINEETGGRVTENLNSKGGRASFVKVDVSSPQSAENLAQATVDIFGGIDYLINNAAIFAGMRRDSLLSVDYAYYQRFLEVNMNGALIVTRAVYQHMVRRFLVGVLARIRTVGVRNGRTELFMVDEVASGNWNGRDRGENCQQ